MKHDNDNQPIRFTDVGEGVFWLLVALVVIAFFKYVLQI